MVTALTASAGERVARLEQALAIARSAGDAQTLLEVTRGALYCYTRLRDGTTFLDLADEMLDAARQVHSAEGELDAGQLRAHALLELGRGEEFERQITVCAQQATVMQAPQLICRATGHQSCRAFMRGDLREAEHLTRKWYGASGNLMDVAVIGCHACELTEVALQRRSKARLQVLSEALIFFDKLLALAPAYFIATAARARVRLHAGERDPAIQLLKQAALSENWPIDPLDRNHIALLAFLADLATHLHDVALAPRLIQELERYRGRHATASHGSTYVGPISYWIGRLHLVSGRRSEARSALEQTVFESKAARSVIYQAWSEYYLAQSLEPGHRKRSTQLVASAKKAAKRHQLGRLLEVLAGKSR
jgi:tetratricopeptide (TPR) repeat protein